MQSVPEDEFYRQASLSQLLTGPDEQELASFRPDITDPLELVEATPELAGMLGSSLEFVDSRWDSLEASPPPTPPPPPVSRPPQRFPPLLRPTEAGAAPGQRQGFKHLGYPSKMETNASMWELKQPGSKNTGVPVPAKPNVTMNVRIWEPQRLRSKNVGSANSTNSDSKMDSSRWEPQQPSKDTGNGNSTHPDSKMDSNMWEPQRKQSKNTAHSETKMDSSMWGQHSKDSGIGNSSNPDSKMDSSRWEQQQQGNKSTGNAPVKSDVAFCASMWEPQRLRSRNAVNSEDSAPSEPQRIRSKNAANGTADVNMWKRQNQGSKTGEDDGSDHEPQRLQGKNAGITVPAKQDATLDANTWERQGIKRVSGTNTAPKREACDTQSHGGKTIKMDAAWQRNLGNVRVHIRDLGMKVAGGAIRRDLKKDQGKVARVKTRS